MRSKLVSGLISLLFGATALFFSANAFAEGDKAAFKEAVAQYDAALKAGDAWAAVEAAAEVLELGKEVYTKFHTYRYVPDESILADLYLNYSAALLALNDIAGAVAPLRDTLSLDYSRYNTERDFFRAVTRVFKKLNGDSPDKMVRSYRALSEAFTRIGEHNGAVKSLFRAYLIVRQSQGATSLAFADLNFELAKAYYSLGEREGKPKRFLRIANRIYRQREGKDSLQFALTEFWLGKINLEKGRHSKALKNFTISLPVLKENSDGDVEMELSAHAHLVAVFEGLGDSDKATEHCKAISQLSPSSGVDGYKPLYKKSPKYPSIHVVRREEGWVLVEFTVTSAGTVTGAHVLESWGGKKFEESALNAVGNYRYAPAYIDGEFFDTPAVKTLFTFKVSN